MQYLTTGSMVYGIGTDICHTQRIESILKRFGEKFSKRILCQEENIIFMSMSNRRQITYLASRFSAKESLSKAMGLGIRHPFSWHNCAILNAENGKPEVFLYQDLFRWCSEKNISLHVSLSDEKDYVLSYALAEQN